MRSECIISDPPSINKARGAVPPLGITCIAGALRQAGHEVKIIDSLVLRLSDERLKELLTEFKPALVGITTMTPTFKCSLNAAMIAKNCGAHVVIGGSHLSAYPLETLTHACIDFGIVGEGEVPMVKLAEALEKGLPLTSIEGLVYRNNGVVVQNGYSVIRDLDSLPMPAHELLPLEEYGTIISEGKIATMVTSRGCPYHCGFCFKQQVDRFFRVRSPQKVVDEIEFLVRKLNVQYVMFYDDTLTVRRDHVKTICEEIIKRKLVFKWEAPTRVNHVDLELLQLMSKAGCIRLRYGVESGNARIRELMTKRISEEQIINAFKWSKQAGIGAFAYFIIGYPTETPETMQETIDFAKKIDADYAMFNVAVPYPKTDLYDRAVQQGIVQGDYWADFTLGKEVPKLKPFVPDAHQWMRKAYFHFYFRPKVIWRELLQVHSWTTLKKRINALKGVIDL